MTKPKKTKQIPLRVPEDLFDRMEVARGLIPRERWIRQVIEERLDSEDAKPTSRAEAFRRATDHL